MLPRVGVMGGHGIGASGCIFEPCAGVRVVVV